MSIRNRIAWSDAQLWRLGERAKRRTGAQRLSREAESYDSLGRSPRNRIPKGVTH